MDSLRHRTSEASHRRFVAWSKYADAIEARLYALRETPPRCVVVNQWAYDSMLEYFLKLPADETRAPTIDQWNWGGTCGALALKVNSDLGEHEFALLFGQ